MSAPRTRSTSPTQTHVVDELLSVFEESMQDPEFRAIHDDAEARRRIIERLVARRNELGLKQSEVAARMSVGQSTISGFETEGADPRLSTLQRYARAVEAVCEVTLRMPPIADWFFNVSYQEAVAPKPTVRIEETQAPVTDDWATAAAARVGRTDFALAS